MIDTSNYAVLCLNRELRRCGCKDGECFAFYPVRIYSPSQNQKEQARILKKYLEETKMYLINIEDILKGGYE